MANDTSALMEDFLGELAPHVASVVRPDLGSYWHDWEELATWPGTRRYDRLAELEDADIVLGFLLGSHLGDALCTSTLPRKLAAQYGCRVYVVRHRSTLNMFKHNPYVAAHRNEGCLSLRQCAWGPGHQIQRLERYFALSTDPFPRPEVYLSDEEIAWAWNVRAMLPRDRPVALMCAHAITDAQVASFAQAAWQGWASLLGQFASVVQLALTSRQTYEEVAVLRERDRTAWKGDQILDNCFILENLPPRQFLAIFAIGDMYFGTNAGGAHVAAAFNLPSIVVLDAKTSPDRIRFPNPTPEYPHTPVSFLYPNHVFVFPKG